MARLETPADRHFFGHGAFSADGALLFTTENVIAEGDGRLGVWDAGDGYRRIGEVPTGGTGPHEVRLMPDGQAARGGERRDRDRPELGAGRAQPRDDARRTSPMSTVATGALVEVLELPAGAAADLDPPPRRRARRDAGGGAAVAGLGARAPAAPGGAPAGARAGSRRWRRRRRCSGAPATMPAAWRSATTARRAAITAPRGNMMLVFDLAAARWSRWSRPTDICGVAASAGRLRLLDRRGAVPGRRRQVRLPGLAFDNHLVRIASA